MDKSEEKYIKRYQNIPWWKHTEMYNDLMKKMEHEYCRWYGSAYGLRSYDVAKLREDILTGKTTFTKWKKEFAESNIRANMGLGPNDPIPESPKRNANLSNVSTEELEKELIRRKSHEQSSENPDGTR